MSATAIMFHILHGMTPQVLEMAEEAMGPRLKEHEESRRRLGISLERAWIETTSTGDVLVFYFEGEDLDASMKKLGESDHMYDLWFREKMFALTGADLCDFRVVAPSELIFESPEVKVAGPAESVAVTFPVLPGKMDEWLGLLDDLKGPRLGEYRDYLDRYGLTSERFFSRETGEGAMVILYAEGDRPAEGIARFARSSHPFDVWLREEMLHLSGIDFFRRQTAPPPHLIIDLKAGVREKAA